ncbi:Cytohesin-1 (PH [Durusdinium trenchii]|uniref:SEC7 and coiled-coil domain-containing protein 1 (CLM1 (SEC7 homolog A (MSec7-1 n=1 Tax=Durusdinium trenchii TaxID=1381693 RepID=A0ABP0R344_9DINO
MVEYWQLMLGEEVPYEARSKRWSDDLGFQSSNPWSDFRGGGLLSLRCLLFLAVKHNRQARILMEEAKYPSRAWYPFSAAGITICQLLAVHLRLHARPMLGPVKTVPAAHPLAMKRFLSELAKEDPVEVFASYWLAAVCKLHKEWRELCARDPDANLSCSFNRVYEYVGVAVESALATVKSDRLKVLAEVNARSTVVSGHNLLVRAESSVLVGVVRMERFFLCLGYKLKSSQPSLMEEQEDKHISGFSTESPSEDVSMAVPEMIHSAEVYQLYRGACGKEGDLVAEKCRIWVDFPNLRIAIAEYDQPASPRNCISLLDISWCHCETSDQDQDSTHRLDVYSLPSGSCVGQERPSPNQTPRIRVHGSSSSLQGFGLALQKLLKSRDEEGRGRLYFIQRRLFQYLWRSVQLSVSEDRLVEAQAVLAFNLNPKDGIAYAKRKLRKCTEDEIGEWLSQVCTEKGGLDPTMLGDYFSRRDTLQIFWNFVRRIDFSKMDIVSALRQLFDTFKPGGEGQVITRILEYFAESYFQQWQVDPKAVEPVTAYASADTVFQVAVSLIMLNTGLHVAAKKLGNKAKGASMSLEEYIANTRRLVPAEEVPDEALRAWFEDISCTEISVEPMPRTPFSKLPVQPNMEGWLIAVVKNTSLRFWAVLVLQRIYLFSDSQGDVDPADVIDLKDVAVTTLEEDPEARKRYLDNLPGARRSFCCRRRRPDPWFLAASRRALEISQRSSGPPAILQKSCKKAMRRLVLVAESADLAEKWVHMISCGP